MSILATVTSHLGTAADYREVFGVPHLIGEATFEIVTGVLLWPLIKRAVRRHDNKHHPKPGNLRLVKHPDGGKVLDFIKPGETLASKPRR